MTLTLRPYQQEAISAVYAAFERGVRAPLVVMPTGSGKAPTIATFVREILEQWPDQRLLQLVHTRELVAQNYKTMLRVWPEAPASVYSAGLNSRDMSGQIVFGSIQSLYKKGYELQKVDLVVVDEAHLIPASGDGMYRRLMKDLAVCNGGPVPLVGFTATPFRTNSGSLVEGDGRVFEEVAYEVELLRMIAEGYLAPITTKATDTKLDTSGVAKRGGEFIESQLQAAVDKAEVTKAAVAEIVAAGRDRLSWLVFSTGVQHGFHIRDELRQHGVATEMVHGEMPRHERDAAIAAHKSGAVRCLVNDSVLTTGFDNPRVDLLACLRPTESAGLWCLDAETEILTSRGWLGIGQVRAGDCAAAYNLDTGMGCWSRILAYLERPMNEGEMWVEYQAPRANFRVTSNHNLIYSSKAKEGWSEYRIGSALGASMFKNGIKMPTAVEIDQPGVPLTDAELYFIGMVLTDGTISSHAVHIYQSERHPEIIDRIERCLNECGLAYGKYKVKATCPDIPERHDRWRFQVSVGKPVAGRSGSGCRHLLPYLDKDFPSLLMSLSRAQFLVLLQAIHDGDGFKTEKCVGVTWTPRSWTICSARKPFIDRLQALAAIHGFTANSRSELGGRKNPIWIVTVSPQAWRSVGGHGDRPQIEVKPATGETVWCVETETGTIVTRRRGKVTVMGNCQMVGRATRLSPETGKTNAIVLDFGGNTVRHGPLDMIKGRAKAKGAPPVKTCPECQSIVPIAAEECPDCGYQFPPPKDKERQKHEAKATDAPLLSTDIACEWLPVKSVEFKRHNKPGSPPSMRVDYRIGLNRYSEWVCPLHEGGARRAAARWFAARGCPELPESIEQALEWAPFLAVPSHIKVYPDGRYWRIGAVRFDQEQAAA